MSLATVLCSRDLLLEVLAWCELPECFRLCHASSTIRSTARLDAKYLFHTADQKTLHCIRPEAVQTFLISEAKGCLARASRRHFSVSTCSARLSIAWECLIVVIRQSRW